MDWLIWLRSRVGRRGRRLPERLRIETPDGPIGIDNADWREIKIPVPKQKNLDAVLKNVRKARVYRGEPAGFGQPGQELLIETDGSPDLAELKACLRIKKTKPGLHCMCLGDPTIVLLGEGSEQLAVISLHHGFRIRWNRWQSDADLLDGLRMVNWLAGHGVMYPREEFLRNAKALDAHLTK